MGLVMYQMMTFKSINNFNTDQGKLNRHLKQMQKAEAFYGKGLVDIVRAMLKWNAAKRKSFSLLKGYMDKI